MFGIAGTGQRMSMVFEWCPTTLDTALHSQDDPWEIVPGTVLKHQAKVGGMVGKHRMRDVTRMFHIHHTGPRTSRLCGCLSASCRHTAS